MFLGNKKKNDTQTIAQEIIHTQKYYHNGEKWRIQIKYLYSQVIVKLFAQINVNGLNVVFQFV